MRPRARLFVLWLFCGPLGFVVGFMSALTAPAPRGLYGLTPVRRELMG